MKKILLSALAVMAFGYAAQAQESGFQAGIHLGAPIGDAGDVSSFNFGADVSYLWSVADNFSAGVTTGYTHFLGKDVDTGFGEVKADDFGYIPVAATGQYSFDQFFVAADLGYAIYAGSGDGDGGFYYQPKVGYHIAEQLDVYVGYKGIAVDGATVSAISVGAAYKF